MAKKGDYSDVELLLREIRHIKANLNDALLGTAFWEEAMKDFITRHGDDLIRLLEELERRRAAEAGDAKA